MLECGDYTFCKKKTNKNRLASDELLSNERLGNLI